MKIGLITFHDTNNFGSYLQTYGLYKKVVDLGFECEIVDYQCKAILNREQFGSHRFSLNPKQILKEFLVYRFLRKKYKNLKTWLAENTHISRKFVKSTITESASDYDKFLIGSDIVWGMDIIGKDTTYFLDFIQDSSKKYAFSASIGDAWSVADKKLLRPLLLDFSGIAVREEEAAQWVEEVINKRPSVVCDPTMLLCSEEWKKHATDKYLNDKYVLVYFPTKKNILDAKRYAKKYGLKCYIVNNGIPIRGFKSIMPINMGDFLSLFCNASFIFTASYHGMLFSIYFNRQFAYYNRAHKSRMNTLAFKLGVNNRDGAVYDVTTMKEIDYEKVDALVQDFRNSSIYILKSMLSR